MLVSHQLGAMRCGSLVDIWVFDEFHRDAFCRRGNDSPGAAALVWVRDVPFDLLKCAVYWLAFGGLVLGFDVPGSAQLLFDEAGTHPVLGTGQQHDRLRELGVERGGDQYSPGGMVCALVGG
jgi:hypothetical protein